MRCVDCSHENPGVAKFCQECGAPLRRGCAGCGTELPPTAKFCHECGRRTGGEDAAAPPARVSVEEPREFAGRRYQIQRRIGEGARKRVYLARDRRLERDVALLLVKSEGLDEAGRLRVRREAQAMAQLGDHPNVATVHDIGEEDGTLYIVTEFLSGGDLEQALQDAGESRRLSPSEAVRVAGELCLALEHAHAHNVVHRDVKPGNIWMGRDGAVKLGDFGLAVSTEHSRLTHEGMMVGTAAYMAPEQALGRTPDARSDLYALGATLYEMLTGRPPFLGDDAVAIISQHLHVPPVAPTWHNPEIPERLEALVLQLLEKDPEKRPASAAAVRARLAAATSASAERERVDEPAAANPLDRLASGVFVGREGALEVLRAGVDQALGGKGRVLLLVGEPGIGKTRTSEELATYARMRGAQVLWGRCYEGEGAPPYWPWMQIIRSHVHERDPKELASELGPGAVDIAEVVSEVRERLPGLPALPKLDPDQARFRLFDSVAAFLRNASRQTPLVIVLDDLHWADKSSLLLLQFVAQELGESRILLIGTYRDVEVGRQHPLEQTLAEMARSERADRVLLRGLTEEDVGRFLELSAGRTPPAALIEAVYRETEGNPFFVHEVVRLLQADGRLEHPERVASWSLEIPQGVRQVVGRRLDALGEDANRVLTVASVIGRQFELRVLARASDLSEHETLELLEHAEEARIIAPAEGPPGVWRFSHALVRETLYGEVRTTQRLRLHRRIAEVLEERYGERIDAHLSELAYHLCEAATGGDVEKAVDYAQRAARRALGAIAYEEAVAHFERALGALEAADSPSEKLRCELLLSRADALRRAGAGEASERAFREAKAHAHAIGSPLHVALALIGGDVSIMPASAGDPAYVRELEAAIASLGDGSPALRARLYARRAGQLAWGNPDEARGSARSAVELAATSDQLESVVEANLIYSALVLEESQLRERLALSIALAERATAAGEPSIAERAWNSASQAAARAGEWELANRSIERLVEVAEEVRTPTSLGFAARLLAQRALREGRLDEAREKAWEARAHARRGYGDGAAAEQSFESQLWGQRRLQGRLGETLGALRVGVQAFPDAPIWRGLLACACAESGELEEARRVLDEAAKDDFAAVGRFAVSDSGSLGLLSEAACALEDRDTGAALYERLLRVRDQNLQLTVLVPFGSAARCLGNLAVMLDRLEEAEGHFEEAISLDRRMRARGWLPRTQCDYARMLLTRGAPGDREKALSLLSEATATAQELGLKGWLDRCIETRLHAQGIDSGSVSPTGSIDALAASLGNRRPDLTVHGGADGAVTLAFSDIEGWTEMVERLGDHRARAVTRDHNRIVREQVAIHGGHEVEIQGDAFLLAFASPEAALRCAVSLQRAFADYGRNHAEPVRIRLGIHTGKALREGERFFGRTVIVAARIAALAAGAEILVSAQVRQQAPDARYGPSREVRLKGIAAPQAVHAVDWRA